MNKTIAIQMLSQQDQMGRYVFTLQELRKLFPQDNPKTFTEGLKRLVKSGFLERACRGVYVNPYAHSKDAYTIERIAKALRKGKYNYISLESLLSEYGLMSQIPMDRLTVMTTGRSGICKTSYGVIEFTHTDRSVKGIVQHIQTMENRPLRIATKEAAVRDLKRVGRNVHLLISNEA